MLLQIDSTAVAHAGQAAANALAAWVLARFPGLPENVAALVTAGIASFFGLITAWLWHRAWVWLHASSTAEGQARLSAWWGLYGKWVGTALAALVTAWQSGNWLAALLPVLAHMPSALAGGFSSTLASQTPANVSKGRLGALVLVGGLLLLPTGRAHAGSLLAQPADAQGAVLPWASPHRFVGTLALGEGWTGPKATDHPTPYGRLGVGYQVSAPVQLNAGFRRQLVTGATWRPEIEVRLVFAP